MLRHETLSYLFSFVMWYFIFVFFNVEKMMQGGVDVKRSHEAFFGVGPESRNLDGMLVDEPLREPEAEHRLSFLDLSFF